MISVAPRTIHVGPLREWPAGLVDAVVYVTGELGRSSPGERVTVVVPEPPAAPEQSGALREALRSLVHASVLELPAVRVNHVYGGTAADREQTLAYVAGAEFVLGATLDLGPAS